MLKKIVDKFTLSIKLIELQPCYASCKEGSGDIGKVGVMVTDARIEA